MSGLTFRKALQLLTVPAIELPQIHQTADAFGDCEKIDTCENGSEMVQAKYKVKCEKICDLTFGK